MVDSIQGFGSMQGMSQMGQMGQMRGGPPPGKALTDTQKQQIKDILSDYDASNVTAEDAKAIFQAFKDAGIEPGMGMRETIEEAGFDAENLRELGMPDDKGGTPPPPPSGGMSGTSSTAATSSSMSLSALQSLQSILSQYDLTNLSDEEKGNLFSQLSNSGLVRSGYGSGYMLDLSV